MRAALSRVHGLQRGMTFDDAVARFFEGAYRTVSFPHDLAYDRKGFVDRMLSASYAPDRDDPAHGAYAADFERLSDEHAQAGVLVLTAPAAYTARWRRSAALQLPGPRARASPR